MSRRLVFVTGKGGVGKSTVAAALALAAAARGRRVLLAAFNGRTDAPPAWPGITIEPVDGQAALAEYLAIVLPRRMAQLVTSSQPYHLFVAAAPGLRELMAVGKVAYEARRERRGAPVWDLVVVDAPATGHVLEALRMPMVAAGIFGGLVRRETEQLFGQLRDPARTVFIPVALPEQLVVKETLELVGGLAALGMPIGPIVANRVRRSPIAAGAVPAAPATAPALAQAALRCARDEAGWAALHRRNLERLRGALDRRVIELPYVWAETLGPREVGGLGEELGLQMGEARA